MASHVIREGVGVLSPWKGRFVDALEVTDKSKVTCLAEGFWALRGVEEDNVFHFESSLLRKFRREGKNKQNTKTQKHKNTKTQKHKNTKTQKHNTQYNKKFSLNVVESYHFCDFSPPPKHV